MKKVLLLAENDSHLITLLQLYAERSGFRLAAAENKTQLILLAGQLRPAAVIVSSRFSGESGIALLPELKALDCLKATPVILCAWDNEVLSDCPEGADALLQKPVMYENFRDTLQTLGIHPDPEPIHGGGSLSS